tara:strand:+ start:214 stop:651 length:438 start_codon:yes stop_codon:yes gene_type:complete
MMWAGGTVLSYLSHELAITALSDTKNNIYNIVSRLNGVSNNHIIKTLDDLDIMSKLQIVEALLKQVPSEKYRKDTAIYVAFYQLHCIVEEIEIQLGEIELILKEHQQKWFNIFRGCEINLDKLRLNYTKMEKRLDMFIKLIDLSI